MLLKLAGEAEEEVAAGLADEVKREPEAHTAAPMNSVAAVDAEMSRKAVKSELTPPPAKKPRVAHPDAWLDDELAEYPSNILLVSSESTENYAKLMEEALSASL